MKQAKKPTRAQKVMIGSAGLFHTDWLCYYEDKDYLHIVSKGKNPAEIKIIDKKNKKVL